MHATPTGTRNSIDGLGALQLRPRRGAMHGALSLRVPASASALLAKGDLSLALVCGGGIIPKKSGFLHALTGCAADYHKLRF